MSTLIVSKSNTKTHGDEVVVTAVSAEHGISMAECVSWSNRYATVRIEDVEEHSDLYLLEISNVVSAGGRLIVREPVTSRSSVESRFTLAGLIDVTITSTADPNVLEVTSTKPSWEGTQQKLSFSTKKNNTASAWKIGSDDLMEDDLILAGKKKGLLSAWEDPNVAEDALVDEWSLVKDSVTTVDSTTLAVTAGGGGDDECGGPSKKTCKNCVCGRAEQSADVAQVKSKKALLEMGDGVVVVSEDGKKATVDTARLKGASGGGCGSCSLGDAFRCKGCPSAGLPAYSVGQKIVIDLE